MTDSFSCDCFSSSLEPKIQDLQQKQYRINRNRIKLNKVSQRHFKQNLRHFKQNPQYNNYQNRKSGMIKFSKILNTFATSNILKPPIALKKPSPPSNILSPSMLAQKLNLSQSTVRKQMINPKNNVVSKQQLEIISIINGTKLNSQQNTDKYEMKKKSPVVTIMGHVDHGKTTLIDFLRKSNIAEKEHGGITQKIGAFHIQCHGQKITFIDTPGHQAFTNMRQRGASMTDIVVLIVAATEGVKKQTLEIIKLINQKKIPVIVAINKIDLPNADPQHCQKTLHQAGLQIQPQGGHIPVVHISAKTGQNISLLSQLILEQTKQLTAVYEGSVEGTVLEAHKNSEGLNAVTMVIQKGVLKPGSILIMGETYTKVKQMKDDSGNVLAMGIPGDAVEIVGLSAVPKAGEVVYQVKDEKKAKFILNKKKQKQTLEQAQQKMASKSQIVSSKVSFKTRSQRRAFCRGFSQKWLQHYKQAEDKLLQQIDRIKNATMSNEMDQILVQKQEELASHRKFVEEYLLNTKDKPNTLNLILKFSNRGIEETILEQLQSVAQKIKRTYEINVNILNTDVGDVSSSDVKNAKLSNAQIITFGVGTSAEAQNALVQNSVVPKKHDLIHTFLKEIEDLSIKKKRSGVSGTQKGSAQVMEIYTIKKGKKQSITVAGIKVNNGKLQKKNKFYIFRGGIPVTKALYADFIKVFKNEQMEVKKGQQCTISFNNGEAGLYQKGDQIFCFEQ